MNYKLVLIFVIVKQVMDPDRWVDIKKSHAQHIKEQFSSFFERMDWRNQLKNMWMKHFHSFINKEIFQNDCLNEMEEILQKLQYFLKEENENHRSQSFSESKFYGHMILAIIYFYGQNYHKSIYWLENALLFQNDYNKNIIVIHAAFSLLFEDHTRQNQLFDKISFQNCNLDDLQQFKYTIFMLSYHSCYGNQKLAKSSAESSTYIINFMIKLVEVYMECRFVIMSQDHINLSRQFGLNKKISLLIANICNNFRKKISQRNKISKQSLNMHIFRAQHQFFQQKYETSIKILKNANILESLQFMKNKEDLVCLSDIQSEYSLIIIIESLIKLKNLQQAQQYIKILLHRHSSNGYGYYYRGIICQREGKNNQAIEQFRKSVEIYQSRQSLSELSGLCYEFSKYSQAISYIKAFIARSYSKLSLKIFSQTEDFFKKFQESIFAITFYEAKIDINSQQLLNIIQLAKYSKISTQSKKICEKIIQNMLKSKVLRQKSKFNISFYYFLTKNHDYEDRYQQYIRRFLSREDDTIKEIYPNILQSIMALQQNIQGFSNMFPTETTSLLFIGVLSRISGDYNVSHQFYSQLMTNIQQNSQKEHLTNIFQQIYVHIIMNFSDNFRSLYLQFLIVQMIQSDPQSAVQCYYKSLNYCNHDYEQFRSVIIRKITFSIEVLKDIIGYIRNRQDLCIENNPLAYVIKAFQKHQQTIYAIRSQSSKEIVHLLLNRFDITYDEIMEASESERQFIIGKLMSTQQYIKNKSKQYQLCIKIDEQQMKLRQQIRPILKNISNKASYQQLHKMFQNLLTPFYQNKYIRNQIIKIINQRIYIYVFQDETQAKLSIICNKIMEDPHYIYASLSNQLMETFGLKDKSAPPNSRITFSLGYTQNPSNCNHQKSLKSCGEEVISDINNEKPRKRTNSETKSVQKIQSKWFQQNDIFENDEKNLNKRREQKLKLVFYKVCKQGNMNKQVACQNKLDTLSNQSQIQGIQKQKYYPDEDSQLKKSLYVKSYEINQNKTRFPHKKKYWQVQKHIFYLNCLVIKYFDYYQSEFKHIAKYYTKTKEINLYDHDIQNGKFSFKIQKGDMPRYMNSKKQQSISKQWLMQQGEYFVVEWIICVAGGIIELQRFGIYNPDIAFRNTIKISQTEKHDTFKMIDFDYAFPVETDYSHPQLLQQMKEIIHFWLTFDFESKSPLPQNIQDIIQNIIPSETINQYYIQEIITYIFYGADKAIIDKLVIMRQKDKFEQKKTEKIMQMLKIHMHDSHLRQFCKAVRQLLSKQMIEIYPGTMNQSMTSIILQQLDRLQHKDIIYQKFMDNIQAYRKTLNSNFNGKASKQ